ncbi:MAG: hypothetical protein R2747_21065 [Pyrinomonadaceae bacterium]
MKRIAICLVFVLLLVGFVNSQTKSMTGTVVSVDNGMYAWAAIVIKVGSKKYFVYTTCGDCNPKIVGKVDEVGRRVQVFYTKIEKGENDGEIKPIKIVEIKKTKPRKK